MRQPLVLGVALLLAACGKESGPQAGGSLAPLRGTWRPAPEVIHVASGGARSSDALFDGSNTLLDLVAQELPSGPTTFVAEVMVAGGPGAGRLRVFAPGGREVAITLTHAVERQLESISLAGREHVRTFAGDRSAVVFRWNVSGESRRTGSIASGPFHRPSADPRALDRVLELTPNPLWTLGDERAGVTQPPGLRANATRQLGLLLAERTVSVQGLGRLVPVRERVATLALPSRRLAIWSLHGFPFVRAWVIELGAEHAEMCAYVDAADEPSWPIAAAVFVADASPVRWALAGPRGADAPSTWADGVETEIACLAFGDPSCLDAYARAWRGGEAAFDVFEDEIRQSERGRRFGTHVASDAGTFGFCSTGSDGVYPVFVGFGADGAPCAVVVEHLGLTERVARGR